VPAVYLYPSQKTPYSLLTNILTAIWGVALALILTGREWLVPVSLLFPAYYLGLSWWVTIQRRRTTH
jgi:hypothetical protein